MNANAKPSLMVGTVARVLGVAPRTVTKWVDTGKIKGYRLLGRGDRRVMTSDLIAFMRKSGIPIPREFLPPVAIGLGVSEVAGLHVCPSVFELGEFVPRNNILAAFVSDEADGLHQALRVCRFVREKHPDARIVLICDPSIARDDIDPTGISEIHHRPVDLAELVLPLSPALNGVKA